MLKHNNYENKDLYEILKTFSYKQQVRFALYCAKDVEHLANDQRVIDCNNVVERWLKGDQSVNLELVRTNALNASATISISAYYATFAAVVAVATAIDVAVANTVTSAHYVVSNVSLAKSHNLPPNNIEQKNIAHKQFCNEYNQIVQNWLSLWEIPNFPKESDFPIFDFLQDYNLISYLLPKKEDYYYLNLNGFDIKHENEAELLKLIDTIHIKKILRRIINNETSLHFAR